MAQITINLLPRAAAQREQRAAGGGWSLPPGWPRTIAMAGSGVAAAGVLIAVSVGGWRYWTAAHRQREWSGLSEQRTKLAQLQAEQKRLDARYTVLSALLAAHPTWAERLNRLADMVPDGVWFSQMTLDAVGKLTLEGSALERDGVGAQTVSKFLTALQADQTFTSVFHQITLQSFKSRTVGSTEVLDFTLVCARDAPAPAADTKAKH